MKDFLDTMKVAVTTMMTVAIIATLIVFGFVAGTHKNQIIDWYNYGCESAIGETNNDEFFNRAIRLSTEKAENLKAESNTKDVI